MSILENKVISPSLGGEAHYSRFIASFKNVGKGRWDLFEDWLISLDYLTDDQIRDIVEMANCGKMELELSIMGFVSKPENNREETLEKKKSRIKLRNFKKIFKK